MFRSDTEDSSQSGRLQSFDWTRNTQVTDWEIVLIVQEGRLQCLAAQTLGWAPGSGSDTGFRQLWGRRGEPLTREQERNGIPSCSGFKCQHFYLH